MTHYLVSWHIDIEADSHEEAAQKALRIQRDPNSTATVFDVSAQDGKPDPFKEIDLTGE